MSEIKFRAWDERTNEIVDLLGFKYIGEKQIQLFYLDEDGCSTSCTCDKEYIVLMQCTGLKDKNGVEIYEGDIVRYFEETGIIKWVNDRFFISWLKMLCHYHEDLAFWGIKRKIEVIGNIYENPELVTEVN